MALDCAPLKNIPEVSSAADVNELLESVYISEAAGADTEAEAARGSDVVIFLDEVSDPRNMGATLRSACFLGAAAVVVSPKNSSKLSPAVSRICGGLELLSASGRLAYSVGRCRP